MKRPPFWDAAAAPSTPLEPGRLPQARAEPPVGLDLAAPPKARLAEAERFWAFMGSVFRPAANFWASLALLLLALALVAFSLVVWLWPHSDSARRVNWAPAQPVPFSHQHHVSGLGIDCRYCHNAVEVSANAGMPPTYTCMTCHSQIWTNAALLEPVRNSLKGRSAAGLAACDRCSGFRLLRSQHSYRQRRRLFELSRRRSQYGADLQGQILDDAVLP